MKLFTFPSHIVVGCALISSALASAAVAQGPANELTNAERAAGWRLLFDGRSFAGWRGINLTAVPTGHWVVEDGAIKKLGTVHISQEGRTDRQPSAATPSGPAEVGGDLMTEQTFQNFTLSWDWKMSPAGNSGVKYNVSEELSATIAPKTSIFQQLSSAQSQVPGLADSMSRTNDGFAAPAILPTFDCLVLSGGGAKGAYGAGVAKAVQAYRDEWLIERDCARLKGRVLSLAPLWVSREDHAIGLTRLLTLAARVLAIIEYDVRRKLKAQARSLTGLYPGQPTRAGRRSALPDRAGV